MAKITHPSMRKAKVEPKKTQPTPQNFIVEDATMQQPPLDHIPFVQPISLEEPSESPTQIPQPVELPKSEPSKKSILENLLFLGRHTKEVNIEGLKFEISTLTQKENSNLMKELYKAGDGSDLFTIRVLTLAYAIKTIGGIPFESIPLDDPQEESQFETAFDKKTAIIENMQKNVVERIHDAYIDLVDESDTILDGDKEEDGAEQLKNS